MILGFTYRKGGMHTRSLAVYFPRSRWCSTPPRVSGGLSQSREVRYDCFLYGEALTTHSLPVSKL